MSHKVGFNIGSGQRKFTTTPEVVWLNVDINPKWEPDIISSGEDLAKHGVLNGAADYVVLHHVLEHYGCGEARALIEECRRILRPRTGSLIICVPDIAMLNHMWNRGQLSEQVYLTNIYGAYMDNEADRHKWGYTYDSLKEFIKSVDSEARFKRFNWRRIPGADIAQDNWILAVEITF